MQLLKLIKEDAQVIKKNDPAYNSCIELFFNYPGFWALFWHRIAHLIYKKGFKTIPRIISGFARITTTVDIHPGATLGRRLFMDHATGVVIGQTTIIGDDVVIYQQVTLGGVTLHHDKRHPTIEDGVVIGAGAKVLGNITVGKNAKIGANSVVIHDVAPACTAVGVPAHVGKRIDNNEPLRHNIMPDFNKQLFDYLIGRIKLLENSIKSGDTTNMTEQEHELEEIYKNFIKSMET